MQAPRIGTPRTGGLRNLRLGRAEIKWETWIIQWDSDTGRVRRKVAGPSARARRACAAPRGWALAGVGCSWPLWEGTGDDRSLRRACLSPDHSSAWLEEDRSPRNYTSEEQNAIFVKKGYSLISNCKRRGKKARNVRRSEVQLSPGPFGSEPSALDQMQVCMFLVTSYYGGRPSTQRLTRPNLGRGSPLRLAGLRTK